MAKARVVFLLFAFGLSFAASLKWIFVSYMALPQDADVPLSYAGILLLLMMPIIAVILYVSYLIHMGDLVKTLFPAWAPVYKQHARRLYKVLPWPLKNFFWEPPPEPFKDLSPEEVKKRMMSAPTKKETPAKRAKDTKGL